MSSGLLSRPPEEGGRRLALSFLDQAVAACPRLADPADSEALHDFRVGLRRLRSCLRAYRDSLADSVPRKLAKRLKRLANATGPGRDAEVQIAWLRDQRPHLAPSHRAGLAWILARLAEQMREAYEDLRQEIDRDFPGIEEDLRRHLSVYRAEIHLDGESPQVSFGDATAAILRGQVADLKADLARIEDAGDDRQAHAARISAKRLRYLIEPFADEIPEVSPIVKRFKGLQDLLGELHDAHVLEVELEKAVETAAAERAKSMLELSLAEAPNESLLRAERRRARVAGLIALARLNRGRRNHLFADLDAEWLEGKADGLLQEAETILDFGSKIQNQ
jgi:CHAD domain-containing protein